jgi:hypothetical protein
MKSRSKASERPLSPEESGPSESADTGDDDSGRHRRLYRRTLLLLVLWPLVGLAVMAWGFQMDHQERGRTIFFAGVAIANLGIAGTLIWAYVNWEEKE